MAEQAAVPRLEETEPLLGGKRTHSYSSEEKKDELNIAIPPKGGLTEIDEERNRLKQMKESCFVSDAFYYFVLGVFLCSILAATTMFIYIQFWVSDLYGFLVILLITYIDTAVGVVAEYHIDSIPESTERIKNEITKKLKELKIRLNQQQQSLKKSNDDIKNTNERLENDANKLEKVTNGFKEVTRHCGELYGRIMGEEGVDTSFYDTLERAQEKIKILTLFYKYRDNTKHKQIEQRMTKKQRMKELTTMDIKEYNIFKLQLENQNKNVYNRLNKIEFKDIAGDDDRIDLYELEAMLLKVLK